jgi:alpha-glucosidase (family GH31 glycosyl hydrolase)
VVPVYRRFAQLREALVPYLIAQARLAVESRRPLMRALCFEAPQDPEIWNWPYEYLLGDDLLVAPVVEPGAQTWRVYLPRGDWVDAWAGSVYQGPVTLERDVPIEQIPVYMRGARAAELGPLFGRQAF